MWTAALPLGLEGKMAALQAALEFIGTPPPPVASARTGVASQLLSLLLLLLQQGLKCLAASLLLSNSLQAMSRKRTKCTSYWQSSIRSSSSSCMAVATSCLVARFNQLIQHQNAISELECCAQIQKAVEHSCLFLRNVKMPFTSWYSVQNVPFWPQAQTIHILSFKPTPCSRSNHMCQSHAITHACL